MDKKDQVVSLIVQGYTVCEIKSMLGYKTDSSVYKIAKENCLKAKKPTEARAEMIRNMREQGKSASDIAKALKVTEGTVWNIIKRENIPSPTEQRKCCVCGSEFETSLFSNKMYCGSKCQHIANRSEAKHLDENVAIEMLKRCGDEWEYVGGYSGSEGHMIVRHIPCGTEVVKSSQTVRKGRKLICSCCSSENAKQRKAEIEAERARKKETKRERAKVKPVKFKLEHVQECAVCGSFYFGRSNSKYCGDECKRAVMNRLSAIKRDTKRKLARTSHSNEITVRSLYNRDNGICWICGEKCDINAHWNSNEYPSIDHITPVSLGGKDEWENVRLAHRICNSLRGNKTVEYPHGCEKVLSIA